MLAARIVRACLLLAAFAAVPALAQSFPSRPLRLIVPFPAGSASDSAARIVARAMGDELRQPINVENRPGANGILGVEAVKNAAGDPHVLLVTASTTHAANVTLYRKLPYDPVRDFTPIAKIGVTAFTLMVRPDFPARTTQEFLDYARAHSGKLSYGHGSAGMLGSAALLTRMGGFAANAVSYKGNPPALNDLLAGVIDFSFVDLGNALVQMNAGKLRGLGVTMLRRSALAPELPTMAEGGLPGFEVVPWVGMLAPAGLPPDAVQRLETAAGAALAREDVRAQLLRAGFDPEPTDGAGLARTIDADIRVWARLLGDAGVKPE